jgi:DNA-directed RNA polymerase specialized sigma24 family protein
MSADDPGSITRWLEGLKAGRPEALEAIWGRYYARVLAVARRRLLRGPHQAVEDGEDVALSALHGLFAGSVQGRFDNLSDRSDLWQLLAAITIKKVLVRRQWYARWKRTGRAASSDPAGPTALQEADLDPAAFLAQAVSNEPTPELAAMFREQLQQLLDALEDPTLRQIAEWRVEGFTNAEIAAKLGRATRTVERKVELIRLTWEKIGAAADR